VISLKAVTAICLGVTLCTAQTINISGTVKDTAGVGISGATVKLEVADISTTSGTDGSFTLTNSSTQIQPNFIRSAAAANPMQIHNRKISFTLSENVNVVISIHDVGGRRIYNSNKTYGPGTHAIVAPLQATGILIYKLNIGNDTYSFKSSPFGTFATERNAAPDNSSALAKQAKTTAVIADVISVVKEGQINYRDSIKTSDTTGIVVKMIPNAGNVTDADGNVYQSVRIGSQVWTVEDLRTTKYSDGTAIPGPTFTTSQWSDLTTPAYCWYEDSTGAAYRQKWGALYNWYAVNTGKLAPEGWRVPTDADWTTLENYLIANGYNWDGTTTENKIGKSMAARTDWPSFTKARAGTIGNDLGKNNASGFSALPGGYRTNDGNFYTIRDYGYWWSATEYDASGAWDRNLRCLIERLLRYDTNKSCGFSVRLLRD
jgi:uncharacterized protein (TIGR02145 family)